jgi:hypothetical protein
MPLPKQLTGACMHYQSTTITRSNTIGALYLSLQLSLYKQLQLINQEPNSPPPCHINEALYHQSGTYHQLRSLSKDQALETCPYPHNHAYITDHCTDERKSHYITSHNPHPPSPPSPSPHQRRHMLAQKGHRIW